MMVMMMMMTSFVGCHWRTSVDDDVPPGTVVVCVVVITRDVVDTNTYTHEPTPYGSSKLCFVF